jgi:hypothetical protein
MADRLQAMSESIDENTLRFAAYAGDGWTSLNIATEAIPLPLGLEEQAAATRDGLAALGYQILKTERVSINGQAAERLIAEIAVTLNDGTVLDMSLLQYTLVTGGRAYSLSFGTPSHRLYEFLPTFELIADTFHTLED